MDAETKLRSLNDLLRAFILLVASPDVQVGHIVMGRAAIETVARMHWGLAVDGDYLERAARWFRERLRTITEKPAFICPRLEVILAISGPLRASQA